MTHTSWVWVWGSVGLLVACGGEFTGSDQGMSTGTSNDTATAGGSSSVGSTGTGSGTTASGAGGDGVGTSDTSSTGSVSATGSGSTASASGGGGGATSNTSMGTGGSGTGGSGGSSAGSAGRAGGGGSGGSGSMDAGADVGRDTGPADAGAPDAVSDPCPGLHADLAVKLAAARVCNPNSPDKVCQTSVQDLCCAYPVAAPDSVATNEYKLALAKFHQAQCTWGCTATLCPSGQGVCVANQGSPSGYACAFTLATPGP